ncbi:hypothetical protein FH972_026537 [Carpinus fangiana]|uniref:Uncharacterized protein n=1 Tax=Carpinus fangiana TaxID=176857 RepID=A0A5N6L496_9ROSI|nr:hypothetical protein FH972_026537 [Carpinus fangiana]
MPSPKRARSESPASDETAKRTMLSHPGETARSQQQHPATSPAVSPTRPPASPNTPPPLENQAPNPSAAGSMQLTLRPQPNTLILDGHFQSVPEFMQYLREIANPDERFATYHTVQEKLQHNKNQAEALAESVYDQLYNDPDLRSHYTVSSFEREFESLKAMKDGAIATRSRLKESIDGIKKAWNESIYNRPPRNSTPLYWTASRRPRQLPAVGLALIHLPGVLQTYVQPSRGMPSGLATKQRLQRAIVSTLKQ